MKEGVPKLPGDHTPNEQMLYVLVLLITQKTLIWICDNNLKINGLLGPLAHQPPSHLTLRTSPLVHEAGHNSKCMQYGTKSKLDCILFSVIICCVYLEQFCLGKKSSKIVVNLSKSKVIKSNKLVNLLWVLPWSVFTTLVGSCDFTLLLYQSLIMDSLSYLA